MHSWLFEIIHGFDIDNKETRLGYAFTAIVTFI